MTHRESVLVIGYGNPGRRDDGLGPALAESIEALAIDGVTVEAPYQLQVEDAATVATHGLIVFADADASPGAEPFNCRPVAPKGGPAWTTHALEPGALLALAGDVYDASPPAALLGVRGFEFDDFGEGLSKRAGENLAAAVAWLAPRLRDGGHLLRSDLKSGTIGV